MPFLFEFLSRKQRASLEFWIDYNFVWIEHVVVRGLTATPSERTGFLG